MGTTHLYHSPQTDSPMKLPTLDRSNLSPMSKVWHRTSRRVKALVSDLQTLRNLLNYLVAYDCVTFFEYLETLFYHAAAQHPTERPHWVMNCSEVNGACHSVPWHYIAWA